jgi:AbiTii
MFCAAVQPRRRGKLHAVALSGVGRHGDATKGTYRQRGWAWEARINLLMMKPTSAGAPHRLGLANRGRGRVGRAVAYLPGLCRTRSRVSDCNEPFPVYTWAKGNAVMSLLREIQDAAVDGASDLESLLRKCRVLAARLKHDDLKTWVMAELDGYSEAAAVPDYRKVHVHCFGHFWGDYGRQMQNVPIPESCIPKDIRRHFTDKELRAGIGALKHMVESYQGESIRYGWPADSIPMFGDKIMEEMTLVQGWSNLPKSAIVNVLSTVRSRILNFALEIEASYPDAGEAVPGETPVPTEVVTQIFNQTFHGPVANVASGHGIEQSGIISFQPGDFRTLATFLKEQGVGEAEIDDLGVAIKEDPTPTEKNFGKKVSFWMGKMVQKSAEGAWKVTTTVGANLLTKALEKYYGMHP